MKECLSRNETISCLKLECTGGTFFPTWVAESTWLAPSNKLGPSNKLLILLCWNQKMWRNDLPSFLLQDPVGTWLALLWIKPSLFTTLLELINVSLVFLHKHIIKYELLQGRVCDHLGSQTAPMTGVDSLGLTLHRGFLTVKGLVPGSSRML